MTTATAPVSTSTKNEALIRSVYDALSRGDMAAMYTLFTPESVSHIPGRNPLSGDKVGVDALVEYFGSLMGRSEGTFNVELLHAYADESTGAGLHHETARRAGKTLDTPIVVVFRMEGDRVAETWVHYHDQVVADAFWS